MEWVKARFGRRARILFVDDCAAVRKLFARVVSEQPGLVVDLASSGAEALRRADHQPYDIVVTDLRMPGMDGLRLVEEVHKRFDSTGLLLVTGTRDLSLPTDGGSARAIAGVVRKPWRPEELLQALAHTLELSATHQAQPECGDTTPLRVLVVEASAATVLSVEECLRGTPHRYQVRHVSCLGDALGRFEAEDFDVVLVDLSLPDARGMDAVSRLHAACPATPIIVLSAQSDESLAIHAAGTGAHDYLCKNDLTPRSLERAIGYAMERKRAQNRLTYIAHHDQMTGLANRRLFRERGARMVERATRTGRGVGILALDLGDFKAVNDRLGYEAGDKTLIEVGRRIESTIRSCDSAARLGGDEFAVLVGDIDAAQDLAEPANRIAEVLGAPIHVAGTSVIVQPSIGIAYYPDDGSTTDELAAAAESAMYRAKKAGGGYRFYDRQKHQCALERAQLELELGVALENGEFECFYQPLPWVCGHGPQRFEALLRWNHPRHGRIAPGRFLTLLEASSQIAEVGAWVIEEACRQAATWYRETGRDVRIAVNVSARQLEEDDLAVRVADALSQTGARPDFIELELTESMLLGDIDAALQMLRRVKDIGVTLAIDDFGSGYSRLEYLAKLPLNVLKLDRSVTAGIGAPQTDNLVKAVIDFAHALGLEVVAEGIEYDAQLQFLRNHQCDIYQGYLAARPMSADDATRWLMAHGGEARVRRGA